MNAPTSAAPTSSLQNPDASAQVVGLWVYPIKSCGGISLREATLTADGIDLDRAWMVVDESGEMVTQRDYPRMALVQPTLKTNEMVLRASGMLALHVSIDSVESAMRVRVWDDTVDAFDMGDVAAQWFTDFLTAGKTRLRLVRFDPDFRRISSRKWTKDVEATTLFSDGFAYLVASLESMADLRQHGAGHAWGANDDAALMQRFRPNIVLSGLSAHGEDHVADLRSGGVHLRLVKPCARCQVPEIDPRTGVPGDGITAALRAYRADSRLDGALTFGMNAILLSGEGTSLTLGDTVGAHYAF
jgi:uncharacterized protein